jgi:hypothetical protein
MLTNILLAAAAIVALLVIGLIVVAALQPADFRISRRLAIAAPAATIFPHVNDLSRWRAWSPWENIDPDLKRAYEGPASGEGASYAWAGNSKVGEGRMTITDSRPSDKVQLRLEFVKPFKATNMADFTFEPDGKGTVVTWSMTGRNNFMAKAFSLLMNMDKLIGKDFEKGLSGLKSIAEAKG